MGWLQERGWLSTGQRWAALEAAHSDLCRCHDSLPPHACPCRQQKDTSPCTGERLAHKGLTPNHTLRQAMDDVAAALATAGL